MKAMLPAQHWRAQAPGLLAVLLLLAAVCTSRSGGRARALAPTPQAQSLAASPLATRTPTPFQPAANTPTAPAWPSATRPPTRPPSPVPSATFTPPPPTPTRDPFRWGSIDLPDESQTLRLVIEPGESLNHGRSIMLNFRPGYPCQYSDHRACLSLHEAGRVVLATVHSGVGGEGQALRSALEGTGFNQASFSLAEIQRNLENLPGAAVTLTQGKRSSDLRVLAAARIPPARLADYFSQPVDQSLSAAAQDYPDLAAALASQQPLLIIETCGWKHPQEPWLPGVTSTTGSVYLLVIGE